MVLGEKVVIFDWEWAKIRPLEMGKTSPDMEVQFLQTWRKIGHCELALNIIMFCAEFEKNQLMTKRACNELTIVAKARN